MRRDVWLSRPPRVDPDDSSFIFDLDPIHLAEVGTYGALSVTTGMGGTESIEWEMLTTASLAPALTRSLVTVTCCGLAEAVGVLDYPDPGSGAFRASSVKALVASMPALSAGVPTTVPQAAITALAIATGWVDGTLLGAAEVGDPEAAPTIGTVMDAAADLLESWWTVDPWPGAPRRVATAGRVTYRTVASTPAWQMLNPPGGIAPLDEEYATRVIAAYTDSTTGNAASAVSIDEDAEARWGARPLTIDLEPLGDLSATEALAFAEGRRIKAGRRTAWSAPLNPGPGELRASGGTPLVDASVVRPGDVVRVHGVWDDVSGLTGVPFCDVPVGRVKWSEQGRTTTTQLEPLGMPARDLRSVIASQEEAA